MPPNNIPHQSVICVTIYYEVCERLPDGKVGTKIKEKKKESIPFSIRGNSLEECQEKTQEFLSKLKDRINDRNKSS